MLATPAEQVRGDSLLPSDCWAWRYDLPVADHSHDRLRRPLVRVALYALLLTIVAISTYSYWMPFVFPTRDLDRKTVDGIGLALMDPAATTAVDVRAHASSTADSDQDLRGLGIEASIIVDPARATNLAKVSFYVIIKGTLPSLEDEPLPCQVRRQPQPAQVDIQEHAEPALPDRELVWAAEIVDLSRMFLVTVSWPENLPAGQKIGFLVDCFMRGVSPWSVNTPVYYLSLPSIRIVAAYDNQAHHLASEAVCAGVTYFKAPEQVVSSYFPNAPQEVGANFVWRFCGHENGKPTDAYGVMEPSPIFTSDYPVEWVESPPVMLAVQDLREADRQVRVLFIGGAAAGLLAALTIEMINVGVDAAASRRPWRLRLRPLLRQRQRQRQEYEQLRLW